MSAAVTAPDRPGAAGASASGPARASATDRVRAALARIAEVDRA
jgi:hypothetical protein